MHFCVLGSGVSLGSQEAQLSSRVSAQDYRPEKMHRSSETAPHMKSTRPKPTVLAGVNDAQSSSNSNPNPAEAQNTVTHSFSQFSGVLHPDVGTLGTCSCRGLGHTK